jgi:hypothetical protein
MLTDAATPVLAAGQVQTFAAVQEFTARHNAALSRATSMLIGATTSNIEAYFETPGGGMMQESNNLTRPGAIKAAGRYNVAFPIRDARDQIAGDDVTLAYLTLEQLQRNVETVFIRHLNWVRFHILKALFNNVNDAAWYEEAYDRVITIRRLANQDGTIYAPNINADTGAEDNHYLTSGYLSSAISNVNNPFPTLRDEIKEHFGEDTNIVVFINPAQSAIVQGLAAFTPYRDPMLTQPITSTVISGSAPSGIPGMVIGRASNVWVAEWNSIPADYMLAIDVSQPGPLTKRVDVPTNIAGRGVLALIARQVEFPLEESFWRDRHGYGVSNRTSAAIMQFKAAPPYDIPTIYA